MEKKFIYAAVLGHVSSDFAARFSYAMRLMGWALINQFMRFGEAG
jgi:hypothetical protein